MSHKSLTGASAASLRQLATKLRRPTTIPLLASLLVVVLLQVELAFSKSVNWDEFFHFSQIHQHLLGRPASWLQAPFVALFFWVPSLPGDNIDHIQFIRLFTLPFELIAIAAIVGMARRFANHETALICGLIYATGGYVFLHAFALRADMIAAALLMTALWIGLCRPLRAVEIVAIILLLVLAFVSTIKAILYAPAFLGVALFRLGRSDHRWTVAGAALLAIVAGASFLWLTPSLPATGPGGILREIGELGRVSIDRMFPGELFPEGQWLVRQIIFAPMVSLTVLLSIFFACWSDRDKIERILFLSFLAPLATVVFYRNSFPYHFAFILPPAMVAIAPVVDWLRSRYSAAAVALVPLVGALALSYAEDRTLLSRQRTIQAGLHKIFPKPVPYIDNSGMAGDFPRAVNRFASGWQLEGYRRKGQPIYSQAMDAEPVPLLLINNVVLQGVFFDNGYQGLLFVRDSRMLQENYIRHWGQVYVAGKIIAAGQQPSTVEIAIPGRYTVEDAPVEIDGKVYRTGSVVALTRGPHRIAGNRERKVKLRWGDHLPRPSFSWPEHPIFSEY